MDEFEWIIRCSARLHAQWPRIAREMRDEAARELWEQDRWRCCEPEDAAVEWIAQGIPDGSAGANR
ncbi:MAG TPA: hypothetical protein VLK85_21275 [Ramlibacter sp.]|nr:hypothetical protein [Ramlibacter sp.]